MKIIVIISIIIISVCSANADYEYEVSGESDSGSIVEGTINAEGRDSSYVEGVIIDEYGNEIEVTGHWTWYREIEVEDYDGNTYTLEVR